MLEDLPTRDMPHAKFYAKLPTLEELENEYIQYVLLQTDGNKEKASAILGVNRKTLYRRETEASAPS
jgi:DNA-binding NtrC family response regulator